MQAIEHIIEDVFLHNFKEHMLIRHTAKDFKFQQDQLIIPKGQEVHIPLSMAQQAFSTENADKMFPSISRLESAKLLARIYSHSLLVSDI